MISQEMNSETQTLPWILHVHSNMHHFFLSKPRADFTWEATCQMTNQHSQWNKHMCTFVALNAGNTSAESQQCWLNNTEIHFIHRRHTTDFLTLPHQPPHEFPMSVNGIDNNLKMHC